MTLAETRRAHAHAVFWFVAANAVLAFLNGYGYLRIAALAPGSLGWAFAAVALWGQLAAACVVLGLLLAAMAALGPAYALPRHVAPPLFAALHFLIGVDKQIFTLFRFHWNGLVWNVLTTPGGWESMHIATADLARGVVTALLLVSAEYLFFSWLLRRSLARATRLRGTARSWLAFAGLVLAGGVADHLVYAVCDLRNVRAVTRSAKVVPFYQPLTLKKLARRYGWATDREQGLQVEPSASFLDYPRAPLRAVPPPRTYNVVWITLDGWRSDAYAPEVTPNLWALGRRSQVFESHWSGGNATRFGLFSMFYGLYGTYWHNFLNERRGPVLIDRLAELGYRFKILSSTSLTFPEFRRTAFVRIPESIEDALPGAGASEKDAAMVDRLQAFLSGLRTGERFFALLFTDTTHAGYYFPPEYAKFKPYPETLEYLKLGSRTDPRGPHNRYLNAVHYSDALMGRVLADLEKRGLLKDTIVLATGDHGEEFYEHGQWGHNGNFSREEIQVPLILYIPGRAPRRFAYRTSHHDLAPTFLQLLGVANPPSDYSLGDTLFTPSHRPYEVSCSWDECALLAPEATFVFGTESHGVGGLEVLDPDYRELKDRKAALDRHAGDLAQLLAESSRFLKK